MTTVAVIDYGMGNLHSVAKALEHAGIATRVSVTNDHRVIESADRVVLPGVGAIRDCMAEIQRLDIDVVVKNVLAQGKPLLGVCVGMQALMQFSEENNGVSCLGILPGEVKFFGDNLRDPNSNERLKIPHMGWNEVIQSGVHPLWQGIPQNSRFYFVHSYYVHPADQTMTAATSEYGVKFAAALTKENLFAVQFHPEKSAQAGLKLYENFLRWDGKV